MNMTPTSCATCGWRGVPAGAFCPSCGAQLQDTMANSGPPPANDIPHTGGRIALLALAGAAHHFSHAFRRRAGFRQS